MLPSTVRIFVCTTPMDMRRSFDGLSCAVASVMGKAPRSGALFAFINKRNNRLKILWWDTNGYCILSKRLHRAVFVRPDPVASDGAALAINAQTLASLIAGVATKKKTQKHARGVKND